MKQSQCNAGGRHCARERGVWQPVFTALATPKANAKLRGTLGQFVGQCCVVESGSTVDAGELYRVYERWAVAVGKRCVMKRRNFETRMIAGGVDVEIGRPGRVGRWLGLRLVQSRLPSSVN